MVELFKSGTKNSKAEGNELLGRGVLLRMILEWALEEVMESETSGLSKVLHLVVAG